MKLLSTAILALAIAIGTASTAYSSLSMGEGKQIANIHNLQAKMNCLASTAVPMYEHDKQIVVPLSVFQRVRDYGDDPLVVNQPGVAGTDVKFLLHNYTQRRGGSGFLTGYLVDKACFLLPKPR